MIVGDPIGLPGLAMLAFGFLVFFVALLAARRRSGAEDRGNTTRSRASMVGIAVQGIAIGVATFGIQRIALDPLGAKALIEAAAVALLMGTGITLFFWASRTMGRNWSIVARTRADHQLVRDGPFAYLRHPIYTALFLYMLALSIAFGHTRSLVVAVPLYALGTWLRIRVEERMLRDLFGAPYDAWAARVKRFVPGVF